MRTESVCRIRNVLEKECEEQRGQDSHGRALVADNTKKSRFSGTELFQNDFVVRCNALDVRHLEQLEALGKALDDVGADVITTVFENAPRESGGMCQGDGFKFFFHSRQIVGDEHKANRSNIAIRGLIFQPLHGFCHSLNSGIQLNQNSHGAFSLTHCGIGIVRFKDLEDLSHIFIRELSSNSACDFLSGSFINTLQSHFPAPRTEHDNRFQQVGFRCAPEMVILAAFSSILHQSVHEFHRADLANVASLGVVNLGNAVPCVAPLRRHQVEHLHFVAFQPELFRCAFVQLSFWVGNYYAFPTHNRLKDGVTNIAERFACTGRTENEDVSVSFGVLRQTNNLFASFGILTEDNATSVVDVADFVLLFRFFAGHPFGCAICAFAGIVNTTGVAALDNVQFSVFSKHDESNPRHHPAEYQSIQPASDGGNAGHKMHQRRLHHGVG